MRRHLNVAELEDLKAIYNHIRLDPTLLVQAAGLRNMSILSVYKSILADIEIIDKRLASLQLSPTTTGGDKT